MQRWILTVLATLIFGCEVQAQTATDPNQGLTIAKDPVSGTFAISWWGLSGRTFFIQQSRDLFSWSYFPVIESGSGQPIMWGFSSSAAKLFLRLEFTDIPTSDPFTADFAGDGMSAYWKILNGFDPLVWLDPNGDPTGDGETNLINFQNNTNAHKPLPVLTLLAPSGALLVP